MLSFENNLQNLYLAQPLWTSPRP